MLPGILLSMYWFIHSNNRRMYTAFLSYVVVCLGSSMYHMRCSEDDVFTYRIKWFRLDIACQQLANLVLASSAPFGLRGGLVILPLIVLTLCTDFSTLAEYHIGMLSHVGCFIVSSYVLDPLVCLRWFLSLSVHTCIDGNRGNLYGTIAQGMWHLMCHWSIDATFKGCQTMWDQKK